MLQIMRLAIVAALLAVLGSTATGAIAKGKPSTAKSNQACLAQGSTLTLRDTTGTVTTTVTFRNATACSRFLAHNPGLTVQSVVPGFKPTGLLPNGTRRLHGNSTSAQFCPVRGSTGQVSYRNFATTTVGMATFSSTLKSHGQCVRFFAHNKNLLIVTT